MIDHDFCVMSVSFCYWILYVDFKFNLILFVQRAFQGILQHSLRLKSHCVQMVTVGSLLDQDANMILFYFLHPLQGEVVGVIGFKCLMKPFLVGMVFLCKY